MSKILIIDDDSSNREILRARLEQSGHEVTEATQGEEGLQMLQATPFDLVFLDVMMPRMDGWQVCRLAKANPATKAVPIVMLTALGQQIDQLRGWESGADGYLSKPWDLPKLMELVDKYCPKAKGQAA